MKVQSDERCFGCAVERQSGLGRSSEPKHGSRPRVLPSTVSRSLHRPTWSAGEQTAWHRVHTPGNCRWIVSVVDPLQASAHEFDEDHWAEGFTDL